MAEISSLKRQREETQEQEEEIFKRQKSYKDIITLLEEEEDEPNEDLSSLISTLQGEISSPHGSDPVQIPDRSNSNEADRVHSGSYKSGSGGEEVMRHLLEASDDELGIPNNDPVMSGSFSSTEMGGFDALLDGQVDGGDLFLPGGEAGFWEFEDHEAANYYEYNNLLQSEIFM